MLRLALALLLAAPFAEITLPDEGACDAPDALACVALAPTDGAVRVASVAGPARYVIEDAEGRALASGPIEGDGMITLPAGAARLVVHAA